LTRPVRRTLVMLAATTAFAMVVPLAAQAAGSGSLDTTFSHDGVARFVLTPEGGNSIDTVLASGAKVLVMADETTTDDLAIVRLTGKGKPDTTFGGGDGVVTMSFLGVDEGFNGLGVLPSGKIVAAIDTHGGGYDKLGLARFTNAGLPDATFGGGDGKVIVDFGKSFFAYDLALLPNGKMLVSGEFSVTEKNSEFLVARLKPDGTLDPFFGDGDGFVTTQFGPAFDGAWRVTVDSKGRVVTAGWAQRSTDGIYDTAVARYTPEGRPDTTFSGDGKLLTRLIKDGDNYAEGLAVQDDDRIVLGDFTAVDSKNKFALLRYLPHGKPDETFGDGDGRVITPAPVFSMSLVDLALDSQGRILVGGSAQQGPQMLVARYTPFGDLDQSFSGDGLATTNIEQGAFDAGISLAPSGKIVLAGGSNGQVAAARFLP
jgi:uncharacterized delta-60 repeat protein